MNNFIDSLIPIFFFIVIFYFLLVRPGAKKEKEHEELIKNLKNKDKILSDSGIIGTIVKINEDSVIINSISTELEIKKDSVVELLKK